MKEKYLVTNGAWQGHFCTDCAPLMLQDLALLDEVEDNGEADRGSLTVRFDWDSEQHLCDGPLCKEERAQAAFVQMQQLEAAQEATRTAGAALLSLLSAVLEHQEPGVLEARTQEASQALRKEWYATQLLWQQLGDGLPPLLGLHVSGLATVYAYCCSHCGRWHQKEVPTYTGCNQCQRIFCLFGTCLQAHLCPQEDEGKKL